MPDSFKNIWWIVLLVLAGGIIFFLSLQSNKTQSEQGVVLKDIFHQQAAETGSRITPLLPSKKADPVPSMAIVTSPVNGHEAGFTIQVHSFQNRNMAESALQSLKASGYQAYLMENI